jgi:hypothetical protein
VTDRGYFNLHGLPALDMYLWDGRNGRLRTAASFIRPKSVGGQTITLLEDSTNDGASVPLVLELLGLTHDGDVYPGAVFHDAGYRGWVLVNGVLRLLERPVCDLLLYEVCLANGMAETKARYYYNGVDQLGQHAFDENRARLLSKPVPRA